MGCNLISNTSVSWGWRECRDKKRTYRHQLLILILVGRFPSLAGPSNYSVGLDGSVQAGMRCHVKLPNRPWQWNAYRADTGGLCTPFMKIY